VHTRTSTIRSSSPRAAIRAGFYACSLGHVLVAATSRGVCAVAFGDDLTALRAELRARFPRSTVGGPDGALDALAADVIARIEASGGAAPLPLDLQGTPFQKSVWRALREIPRGATSTYAAVAARIGAPRAVRAVGTACGKNPVAVIVPCHRVVREDGTLGGYRWGLGRKRILIARERSS
jgi:AraC family transcriptional regulator of adaptative response/methylated-DNA-[protein]-cysteine methyltransferase